MNSTYPFKHWNPYYILIMIIGVNFTGMSWIQTIFIGTVVIRLLVGIPIAVSQQKALAKLEDLQPRFKKLAEDLKAETGLAIRTFGWDEKTAKRQFIKSVGFNMYTFKS